MLLSRCSFTDAGRSNRVS